jgi:hypothetical protein
MLCKAVTQGITPRLVYFGSPSSQKHRPTSDFALASRARPFPRAASRGDPLRSPVLAFDPLPSPRTGIRSLAVAPYWHPIPYRRPGLIFDPLPSPRTGIRSPTVAPYWHPIPYRRPVLASDPLPSPRTGIRSLAVARTGIRSLAVARTGIRSLAVAPYWHSIPCRRPVLIFDPLPSPRTGPPFNYTAAPWSPHAPEKGRSHKPSLCNPLKL